MGPSRTGTLILAEQVILRDAAYRERVKMQVEVLSDLGPVHVLVFGIGSDDEKKLLTSKLRPLGLETIKLCVSGNVRFLSGPLFLYQLMKARRQIRKARRGGWIGRIQLENLLSCLPVLGTRAWKKQAVYLDYHGVVPEEVRDRRRFPSGSILYFLLKRLERHVLERAKGIVCVSHPFREYLETKLSVPPERIRVEQNLIPEGFAPRAESREYYRKLYGLEEKFVFVYSGSLMPHQCPGAIAGLFKGVRERIPDAYLVILTLDQRGLRRFLDSHRPFHGAVTYMRLEHDDMPQYLAAGDLALLLREEHLINTVASPTKFPEYLACGLPVVVSKGATGAAEFVEKMDVGVVIDLDDLEGGINRVVAFAESYRHDRAPVSERCRKAARDVFLRRRGTDTQEWYRSLE
jgi:glycosyltransferase involved in cell wall biosynthesis